MKKVYLFICLLLAGTFVHAASIAWSSATTGGAWNTGTNWVGGSVPGAGDDVVFNNTTGFTVTLATSVSCRSISIQGTANVTLSAQAAALTITLGAATPALNINASRALTVIGAANAQYASIIIPTGGTATINGALNLGSSVVGVTGQVNQLLASDAGSVVVSSTGSILSGQTNANPFGTTSVANDIVVFKSGSKFTEYTNANPWGSGMTAPNEICVFQQGSFYYLYGGSGLPNIAGRTLGTLQLSGGNNGSITNTTSITTTILDSLIITATSGNAINFFRNGGAAVPTFSFNNIRISAPAASNTSVVFTNDGTNNSTVVINGGVIVNTAAAATGNASLTLGNSTVNASSTSTAITFTGTGKTITTEDQGAGAGVPLIAFATNVSSNSGTKTTNLIIDSTASITLNANLDLTTTNITSNLTVRVRGVLSVGSGYTLTTNNKLTLQSTAFGTGSIGYGGSGTGGTITGNTIVQRYIPANAAWRTLGMPFNSSINTYVGGTANTNEVSLSYFAGKTPTWAYYYKESNDDGKYGTTGGVNAGWTAITGSTTGLSTKNGLLLYGSKFSAAQTLSGTGSINYGDQTIALSKTVNGWNLIANPFASNISFTSIVNNGSNSGVISSNTVYRVNPLGGGAYSFSSFVSGSSTGTNGGSDVIENGSSFFVKAAAATNLTIKESDKTTNAVGSTTGGVTLMGVNDNYNSIRLNLKGANTFSDEVVFVWGRFSNATEGFDANLDAYDLGASGTHDLSIVGSDNINYSIFNGTDLSNTPETRTYKLAIKGMVLGGYEFDASLPKALDRNNEAYIVDNYLKTATLVTDGLVYKFDVTTDAASKAEDRFQLEIRKKLISVIDQAVVSKTYLLGNPSNNNQVAIHFGQDAQAANWQLVDLSGRKISSGVFANVYQGDTRVADIKSIQSGTYLISIVNDNEPAVVLKWVKF